MTPIQPMIEHMSIGVSDYARSLAFYDAVLAPLGFVRVSSHEEPEGDSACWGPEGEMPSPEGTPGAAPFWIQHRADVAITPADDLRQALDVVKAQVRKIDAVWQAALYLPALAAQAAHDLGERREIII